MKVIVVGSGNKGSAFVKQLHAAGHRVLFAIAASLVVNIAGRASLDAVLVRNVGTRC